MHYPNRLKRSIQWFVLSLFLLSFPGVSSAEDTGNPVHITAIKMAHDIDERFKPVRPAKDFPEGTAKVYCWFEWKDAQTGTPIITQWTYLNENISILDYTFPLPRKDGSGGVALAMPTGKTLPPGDYEVRLESDKRVLFKSLKFKVLKK